MPQTLPVATLISVAVNLALASAQSQSLNTLLVLDDTPVIDPVERLRSYSTLDAVASDYGTSGNVYGCAVLYFAQTPQPSQFLVGRWVKAASSGGLKCATLSAANQAMTVWNAITAGSFSYQKDGGVATNVTGLNFSAAANLSAVAAIIRAAMTGVTVQWNAVYSRFEFTSNTTGVNSAVSFLTAAGTGTDISSTIGGRSTSSGAYVFTGLAPETAASAVALFDSTYGQTWYALMIPAAVNADHQVVAAYIEAATNKHVYGVTSQEAGCLVSTDTTNIAYLLSQAKYRRSVVQYSSSNAYAVASLIGRAITTDFQANNTTIDLMYKQEPGITAESINTTQAAALASFKANVFVNYNNNTAIIQYGDMSSGDPIDVITGTDWLATDIQTACYNLLYTSPTKVPQTEAGSNLLVATIESRCAQGVSNGLLGPGVWTGGPFGTLNTNDFLAKGFYVYSNPINLQSQSDRAARKAPAIQIAAKLAGAFRSISVSINVNR